MLIKYSKLPLIRFISVEITNTIARQMRKQKLQLREVQLKVFASSVTSNGEVGAC